MNVHLRRTHITAAFALAFATALAYDMTQLSSHTFVTSCVVQNFFYCNFSLRLLFKTTVYIELSLKPGFNRSV